MSRDPQTTPDVADPAAPNASAPNASAPNASAPNASAPVSPAPSSSGPDAFALRFPVVALVTSAGGLDALTQVLGPLPADLPAAVIVAQHLAPDRVSHLTTILHGRTALRVREAQDGDELVVGTVLVTPPARHLLVTSAARIGLLDVGRVPPARPSADLLLATLAVTCGPRVLAVVLTGMGSDAQAGIRAVSYCGGTVFAQSEATSEHFGMPGAAIGTGLVDRVVALPDISVAIRSHARRQRG